MKFSVETFIKAALGGSALGFGLTSLMPLIAPNVPVTNNVILCWSISGGVVMCTDYLYGLWRLRR